MKTKFMRLSDLCKEINWDTDGYLCMINNKRGSFIGSSFCHPDDVAFFSEYTGKFLAEFRARIEVLKDENKNVLNPQIKILKTLLLEMNSNPKINFNSLEVKKVKRKISVLTKILNDNKKLIKDFEESCSQLIKDRDYFIAKLKKIRGKK